MVGKNEDKIYAAALQNAIDSERLLRNAAEQEMRRVRKVLEGLAVDLAGEQLDAWSKRHTGGLETITTPALGQWISRAVQERIHALEADLRLARRQLASRPVAPEPPAPVLRSTSSGPVVLAAAASTGAPQSALPAPEAPPSRDDLRADFRPYTPDFEPAAGAAAPAWLTAWLATSNFDKAFTLVQLLGRTGEPNRVALLQAAAEHLGQKEVSGSLKRAVDHLIADGFLEVHVVPWKRVQPHLWRLTDHGLDAYRLLFGEEPEPPHLPRLLARHKSLPHTYLILETQRLLESAGYQVQRFPEAFSTSQGRYEPDLLAILDGRQLFIEAEMDTDKKAADRKRKWARYWEVTGGALYLTVVDQAAQQTLLSELRYWAHQFQQAATVGLLPVTDIRGEFQGWEIWDYTQIGTRSG